MKIKNESRQLWARHVADALTKNLNSLENCPFYWASAKEDNFRKEPTCIWPEYPKYLYKIDNNCNEGIHVIVFHQIGGGQVRELLTVKFLTGIINCGNCIKYLHDFFNSFCPEKVKK